MSCFIVSNKNLNTIATYIMDLSMRNSKQTKKLCREVMGAIGSDFLTGELLTKHLYSLNAVAYLDRYGEEVEGSAYYEREDTKNLFQVIKYLDCFLYQCFEGETPQDPLYKVLAKISSYLCSEAVGQSAEYIKAEWN